MKFWSKCKTFYSWKCIWKYSLWSAILSIRCINFDFDRGSAKAPSMFVSWLYLLVQQATRYRKWWFFGLYTFRPPATSALDRKMHIIMATTWQPMKPIPTSLLPLLSVPFYTRFDTNTKFGFVHCQVPGDVSFETNVLSFFKRNSTECISQ